MPQYANTDELEAKLAERYDGPISQREGPGGKVFSYIPWTETVRRLNKVFGPNGWGTSEPRVTYAEGVYTVSLLLRVDAVFQDDEGKYTGGFTKSVPGVGSAVARGQGDDNASKAALSDAISRAAKLLGDQFGFFLYEEKGGKTTSSSTGTAPAGRGPSEKQMKILTSQCGFSEEEVREMPFAQWKKALDDHFSARAGAF